MSALYVIRNSADGREYVGTTSTRDPRRAWWLHEYHHHWRSQPLYVDMRALGFSAFTFHVIETGEKAAMRRRLPQEVAARKSFQPYGYNGLTPTVRAALTQEIPAHGEDAA